MDLFPAAEFCLAGAEVWETRPPFPALLMRRDEPPPSRGVKRGEEREIKRKSRRGQGVAVVVMVTLTGGSAVGSGGAESGSARGGRASGDTRWVLGHRGGWLSPRLAARVLLPAAVPGPAGSPGAAPSSLLAAVSAFSGVPVGSWAPGPALGEGGGHAGVSPVLGCSSDGARAFGHSRAEEQVVQPWGRTDGREVRAAGVLPWPPP